MRRRGLLPFIRLSDNYIDHPKFLALSASAFRLWHEGMAFCRKHQTDGLIPMGTLQGFRYYKSVRAEELAHPYKDGAHPLWEPIPGFGYRVHDYLFWNLSKEEEQTDKDAATARMRRLRKSRRDADGSPEQGGERSPLCAPFVPDTDPDRRGKESSERGSGGKPARMGSGVLAGQLPRDHLRHAECGRVCLHEQQFERFAGKYGGDPVSARAAVRSWARAVLADWNQPPKSTQPIAGTDFQFWDARWLDWHGKAEATPTDDAMWAAIGKKGPSVRP